MVKCEQCGKELPNTGKLNQHMRVHSGERPFVCSFPGCEKSFARSDNRNRHVLSHRPESERPLKCSKEGCDRRFLTRQKLTKHEKLHEQPKPFECGLCGKTFAKRNLLRIHESIHSGVLPYPCPHESCKESFKHPHPLERHIERRHPVTPRFTCTREGCDERFFTFSSMLRHRKAAHTKEFQCRHCTRQFVRRSRLKEHEATHDIHPADRRKYPCPTCGKNLSSSSNRRTHIAAVHEKRMSFHCPICSRAFRLKQTMQRHVRSIHGVQAAEAPAESTEAGVGALDGSATAAARLSQEATQMDPTDLEAATTAASRGDAATRSSDGDAPCGEHATAGATREEEDEEEDRRFSIAEPLDIGRKRYTSAKEEVEEGEEDQEDAVPDYIGSLAGKIPVPG